MGGLFKTGNSAAARAAKEAERQAEYQRAQATKQHQETLRQAELAERRAQIQAADMAQRQQAAETLQQNLRKIEQDKKNEIPEIVVGGEAEEEATLQQKKRRRKTLGSLSESLGVLS